MGDAVRENAIRGAYDMSPDRLGIDLMARAKNRLRDAERSGKEGRYPEAVRYSQECSELALKGCLRLLGIEYPKSHDVGNVLIRYRERFPIWFRTSIDEIAGFSHDLFAVRGLAMYGDEDSGTPAGVMFLRDDSLDALRKARVVFAAAKKLAQEAS